MGKEANPLMNEELIWFIYKNIVPAALSLLPGRMDSAEARANIMAIGMQESEFIARQQGGTARKSGSGPAKSFWQFEKKGGVQELLSNETTRPILIPVLNILGYPEWTAEALHEAMEHNDVLACVMARLLLYIDPQELADSMEVWKAWRMYLRRWRPGLERPKPWPKNYDKAWALIRT